MERQIPRGPDIQGRSFADLLFDNHADHKNIAYFVEHEIDNEFLDAFRENDYKLVLFKDKKYVLYNLTDDPEELNDISKENPEIANSMLQKVQLLRKENNRRKIVFSEGPRPIVDKETLDNLRHLGYIQ